MKILRKANRKIYLITILILLLIGLASWIVLKETNQAANNYQECAAQGYPIIETYPEVCTTPGGKSFTNPKDVNVPIIPGQGCVPQPGYACPE